MSDAPQPRDYQRPNQLWTCAAGCDCPLGPTRWGRCRAEGTRCTPRLSLRGRRGVFVASCVFATLGLLILGLGGPWRNAVVEPGPVTSAHTQALEQVDGAGRCAACHEAATKDPLAWLKIASGNLASLSDEQATRCLKCHERSLDKQWARSPHNVSPDALAQSTQRIGANHALDDIFRVKLAASGENACSTCHKEHQGAHANIAQLTDQQCQACHAQAFKSFADGHPEFRHTLPSSRSHIRFDHVAHVQKHFPEKHETFACNRCHEDDARRDVKRLAGFDRSCGQCHSQPIDASGREGLIAFAFPTLNLEQLKSAGRDIGVWPATAQGEFDGALPPLVRTLLLSDDEATRALEHLGPQFDFSQTKSPSELHSVAGLAWGYKRLLNDLAHEAPQTLRKRLGSSEMTNVVVRQLPPGLFREARRRWLAELSEELATSGRMQPSPFTAITTVAPQVRSELLIENPLAKRKPQAGHPAEKPLPAAVETQPTQPASIPVAPSAPPTTLSADPADLVAGGTWYLDDATLSVRYRPRGHGDELVRLLIDVAAASTPHQSPQSGLLSVVLADPAFKSCVACHSIDTAGDHYAVNWQVQYRDTSRRRFNEFSHRPHLTQPGLANCTHCHQMNTRSDTATHTGTPDPMAHAHDFHPITKATCATCHTTTQSGGRCTLCHSYHAGAIRGQ